MQMEHDYFYEFIDKEKLSGTQALQCCEAI